MPKRIQRKRTKGWRMPEGAVYVGRPTEWGNPHRVHPSCDGSCGQWCEEDAMLAVEAYRFGILSPTSSPPALPTAEEIRRKLAGKDLACWCPLKNDHGERVPCHADVLLQLANPEVVFPWAK